MAAALISNRSCFRLVIFMSIVNILLMIAYMINSVAFMKNTLNIKYNGIDDAKFLLDMNDFEYLISKPQCSNNSLPYFVTLVHSAPMHFKLRTAIRETWGHSDRRTLCYFLIGRVDTLSLQKQIIDEEATYNDIIQGNFIDTYHNLTYKHVMGLKWFAHNCRQVRYLVKMDDDVFMNVPAVYEYLKTNISHRKTIRGIYHPPQLADRQGKWKITPEQLRDEYYPEFAFGPSVIYESDFVVNAYEKSRTTRFFWVDDLFVSGYIRMQLNVKISKIHSYILFRKVHKVLNGSIAIPKPVFMFTWNDRTPNDHRILWKRTELYRLKDRYP